MSPRHRIGECAKSSAATAAVAAARRLSRLRSSVVLVVAATAVASTIVTHVSRCVLQRVVQRAACWRVCVERCACGAADGALRSMPRVWCFFKVTYAHCMSFFGALSLSLCRSACSTLCFLYSSTTRLTWICRSRLFVRRCMSRACASSRRKSGSSAPILLRTRGAGSRSLCCTYRCLRRVQSLTALCGHLQVRRCRAGDTSEAPFSRGGSACCARWTVCAVHRVRARALSVCLDIGDHHRVSLRSACVDALSTTTEPNKLALVIARTTQLLCGFAPLVELAPVLHDTVIPRT